MFTSDSEIGMYMYMYISLLYTYIATRGGRGEFTLALLKLWDNGEAHCASISANLKT